ncbi:hypothetical protein [Sulfitobacter geojensis]|jgi:hypothetical protein|uniref:Uncharacterized protein n=1 Tax=Sulfitobacter geojensis TaxID=1342299 RepID=A0AAE2W0H0_9RHOB|nr:hypothetical protein [Sulfitobacter geojensis]KHA50946.1 hypothetical protein Z947_1227 [Sulfitobacter geojensis]MBM1691000.1 hypothetical protein [Sulfitobacter geojensis]MBM1695066.1 hypothetical protein [Sulfitobacter geojensis]MBM1707139.1 hypothetical protein [Sulfitobacter geojensis]MBM1711289.1 hypothetical protein [Sulfitobacter geojensis]
MLNIYAQSMLTATRSGCVRLREAASAAPAKRRRWFSRRKTICIDPAKL